MSVWALSSQSTSGRDPVVPDQREAERVLGLDAGQPGRRVEHGRQAVALGQLAGLGGDAAGDPLELVAAGQVVLDDDELPLQLDGDLHDGREDDDEGPAGLAGGDGRVEGLDDLDVVQELVEVAQDEDRRCRRGWPSPRASGWPPAGRWH